MFRHSQHSASYSLGWVFSNEEPCLASCRFPYQASLRSSLTGASTTRMLRAERSCRHDPLYSSAPHAEGTHCFTLSTPEADRTPTQQPAHALCFQGCLLMHTGPWLFSKAQVQWENRALSHTALCCNLASVVWLEQAGQF